MTQLPSLPHFLSRDLAQALGTFSVCFFIASCIYRLGSNSLNLRALVLVLVPPLALAEDRGSADQKDTNGEEGL